MSHNRHNKNEFERELYIFTGELGESKHKKTHRNYYMSKMKRGKRMVKKSE